MRIERIQRAHLESVADLEQCCFAEPWSVRALELLLTDAACGFVAVSDADGVIAYGGMLLAPGEGQITNIATHPDARRRGAARRVLEALIERAKTVGAEQISLEVRASNAAAIALYEAHGFLVAGRRRGFYRAPTEDALVMLLPLSAADPRA